MTISPVSSVNNNIRNLSFGENVKNKKSNDNKKRYLNVPNVILGSLSIIGILGMADILICKGKHINKLTGTDKQINRLNDAIKGLEKHQEAKNKQILELIDENKTLREELKQAKSK